MGATSLRPVVSIIEDIEQVIAEVNSRIIDLDQIIIGPAPEALEPSYGEDSVSNNIKARLEDALHRLRTCNEALSLVHSYLV